MMIEIDKMLHLRRYVTLVVRSQLRLPRFEAVSRGYVHVHPRHASPRSEIYVATCNRTYSTTTLQSLQSDVVDHKLMSFCDDVKKGQVLVDNLKEVIDLCSKNDYQLSHDTGVLLLKCCGNRLPDLEAAERDHLVNQVWRLVKKNSGALMLEHYNTLLGVNEENSKSVNPKKFLANISVEPDANTYRLLLNAATKTGNSEHVWDILSIIKNKNKTIYEEAINALVQICATNDNIAEVERMITLMQNAELSTAEAYTVLACGYARLGDIPNLVKILNEEPQDNAGLLRITKVLSMSNNSRHIPVVLNFLMASVPAIESEISKMIAELIRIDRTMDAHTIINCLAMNNATKDVVQSFVNSFMNELVLLNAPIDDIIKYANDFVDSGCNQQALINVAETGLKLGRMKLCLAIFQAMRIRNIEVRPHYYWPLLVRAYRNKGEPQIFSLIKSMMDAGVEIDSDTLLNYVYPYINTANTFVTLQKLLLNNVPGVNAYTPLLSFLLQQNRLQELMPLHKSYLRYKVYYRDLMKPLTNAYLATKDFNNCVMFLMTSQGENFVGMFLKLLLKNEYQISVKELLLLLEEFKKCKAKISQEDAAILKNRLRQNENFNDVTKPVQLIDDLIDPSMKSTTTLDPMHINTKKLTYYLVELKSNKAYTKNVGNILHKLLVMYCIENNPKKAEEIKQEYDACQYEWSTGMKLFLFELYLKHNKLDKAELLLPDLEIMPNEFHLDEIKIVMYATALVKADNSAKAFDVVKTFNAIHKRDAQTECYKLLQTLAQSRYHASTKDMLNLLLKKNYCQVSMELLQPLVAIPLECNDILDAVNVLTECAQKYHEAPLALEVLTELLKQKYNSKLHNASDYIEQVYDMVATTQSVKVANTLLAIALATLNKTKKLQNLLQDHELSVNCLEYHINNTKNTNSRMDGLQNLFKVADANHLNQDRMCRKLLFFYSKTGDCNRALELWEIMCTKNINPSKEFKNNFIQFLLSHKIPLPPNVG